MKRNKLVCIFMKLTRPLFVEPCRNITIMNNKKQTNDIQPSSLLQESIAAYIFRVLLIFLVLLLIILLKGDEDFSVGFNRAGIILQLLAGLSIIPQVLSSAAKEKVDNFLGQLEIFFTKPNLLMRFLFSIITIVIVVIVAWFSLLITDTVLKPLVYFVFGVVIFAEVLFLLFSLFFKTKLRTEKFVIHLAVLEYLINLLRLGIEKMVLQLSLPIFIFGCILQFLSTYI